MNQFEDKIILSTNHAYHIVSFEDILYCKSNNSSTTFFLNSGEQISTSLPIGSLEQRLAKRSFVRSHQSYIVNMLHVLRVHKQNGTELELTNHCLIPVSTRRKSAITQFLDRIEHFQDN